jgi:hypothetical protein
MANKLVKYLVESTVWHLVDFLGEQLVDLMVARTGNSMVAWKDDLTDGMMVEKKATRLAMLMEMMTAVLAF